MKKYFCVLLILLPAFVCAGEPEPFEIGSVLYRPDAAPEPEKPYVRAVVTRFALPNDNMPLVFRTLEALKKEFGKNNFEAKVYSGEEVNPQEADLVLSSAGTYRRSLEKGAKDLGTVVSAKHPDPNKAEGSLFIALKSRKDISGLKDLKGKRVTVTGPKAFAGWHIAQGRIADEGYDPDAFFSETVPSGHDMTKELDLLRSGKADAAVVRTCFLEELKDKGADVSDIKPVAVVGKTGAGCLSSTALYPNWTLFSTPHAPPEVTRRAALAILHMEPDADGRRWGVASDFSEVDRLFKTIKRGPYEYLRDWSWKRIWEEYRLYIVSVLVLLGALILHSARASYLVRKRTAELNAEEALRRGAEDRIAQLQKMGAVGQVSSIVAHELRQPLSSIVNFSQGLQRLLEREESGLAERIGKGIERIREEAFKADAIVTKVRSYAKRKGAQREAVDLGALAEKALHSVSLSSSARNVKLVFKGGSARVFADPLEIELVLVNLIKNAAEAASQTSNGKVEAAVEEKDGFAEVRICDTGPRLTGEEFSKIADPLHSQKEEGLGLGISIARAFIENHGGSISYRRLDPQGIEAVVRLPLEKEGGEKNERS